MLEQLEDPPSLNKSLTIAVRGRNARLILKNSWLSLEYPGPKLSLGSRQGRSTSLQRSLNLAGWLRCKKLALPRAHNSLAPTLRIMHLFNHNNRLQTTPYKHIHIPRKRCVSGISNVSHQCFLITNEVPSSTLLQMKSRLIWVTLLFCSQVPRRKVIKSPDGLRFWC